MEKATTCSYTLEAVTTWGNNEGDGDNDNNRNDNNNY